jgi:hypothetical protein
LGVGIWAFILWEIQHKPFTLNFLFVRNHFLLSLLPQTNTGKMFNTNALFNTNNPLAG